MPLPAHYRIDYLLNGSYKSFHVSSEHMDDTQAWHSAAVDSGFVQIPKYRIDKAQILSKPQAQAYGISQVEWAKS